MTTVQQRQDLGCGFERALPPGDARPWTPRAWVDRGEATTVCPGYTSRLPVVIEIADAYPQWEHGTLTEYLGGVAPSRIALDYLTTFHYALEGFQAAKMREKAKA